MMHLTIQCSDERFDDSSTLHGNKLTLFVADASVGLITRIFFVDPAVVILLPGPMVIGVRVPSFPRTKRFLKAVTFPTEVPGLI